MTLDYSIVHRDSQIQVNVSGLADYLTLHHLWHDIVAACSKHECFDILGVSNTAYRSMEDAYDRAAILAAAGVDHRYRIAWVQKNESSKEFLKLAEAVVRNRMLASARVFDSLAEAKRWLAEKSGTDL